MENNQVGRNTVVTSEVIAKLVEAFKLDSTIEEACYYAEIHPSTYYRHVKSDPDFARKIEGARCYLILRARETVARNIGRIDTAKWYLERKRSEEFGKRDQIKIDAESEKRGFVELYRSLLTSEVSDKTDQPLSLPNSVVVE